MEHYCDCEYCNYEIISEVIQKEKKEDKEREIEYKLVGDERNYIKFTLEQINNRLNALESIISAGTKNNHDSLFADMKRIENYVKEHLWKPETLDNIKSRIKNIENTLEFPSYDENVLKGHSPLWFLKLLESQEKEKNNE